MAQGEPTASDVIEVENGTATGTEADDDTTGFVTAQTEDATIGANQTTSGGETTAEVGDQEATASTDAGAETPGTDPSVSLATSVTNEEDGLVSVSTSVDAEVLEGAARLDAAIGPESPSGVADRTDRGLSTGGAGDAADTTVSDSATAPEAGAYGRDLDDSPASGADGQPSPAAPAPVESLVLLGAASAVGLVSTRVSTPAQFSLARTLFRSQIRPSARWLRDWGLRLLGLFGVHDHEDPLDNETRVTVYDHVTATPGTYLSEISEATGLPLGTVRYHLKVLRREGYVTRTEIRGRQRYLPVGEELSALDAALAEAASAAVLRELARAGADTVSGLADRLDRDPSTVSYHLDKLASAELVERERTGQAVENRLTSAAAAVLAEELSRPGDEPAASAD